MRRGLSIVELTTAVAILGIVVSLAVPALDHAASSTRTAHCASNLRQMARAATLYATEHRLMFPPGLLMGSDTDATNGDVRAWDWWRGADGTVRPGPLWTYTDAGDALKVLTCPTAVQLNAAWAGDPVTGYNYNVAFVAAESRAAGAGDAGSGAWDLVMPKDNLDGLKWLTLPQCARSGVTALFGTGGRAGGTNKFMRSPVNVGAGYATAYAGGQAFAEGSSNVAWIDGHVSARKHPFKGHHFDDLPNWLTDGLGWPDNGFLSNDASAYDPRP